MITSEAAKLGVLVTLHLMAVLSISLGIFNLLPLPVLDGGHVFLLGLEKLRGRRLGKKAEEMFSQAGFGIIICLAVLVSLNDLVNFGFFDKVYNAYVGFSGFLHKFFH
jgi:regulator of sigma E protease